MLKTPNLAPSKSISDTKTSDFFVFKDIQNPVDNIMIKIFK